MNEQKIFNLLYLTAESQGGYFTTSQAESAGYSRANLHYQVKSGRFIHISSGVYRIAKFPHTQFEDLYIALLKTGLQSTLSHQTALVVYGLSDNIPSEIHVTLPRTNSRRRKGVRYHTKSITDDEIIHYEGLRVTTVERALVDLFESGFDPRQLRLAVEQAFERGLTTPRRLARALNQRRSSSVERFESLLGIKLQ